MPETVLFVIGSVVVGASLSLAAYLFIVNRASKKIINNLNKDIEDLLAKMAQAKIENTNGFTKFLSESRDEAFKYIEEVQSAIESLKLAISSKDDKKIKEANEKVLSFLPDKTD